MSPLMKGGVDARAIKEGIDNMPSGVVFARMNGLVILMNACMDELCHQIFGAPLQNARLFWEGLSKGDFPSGARLSKAYTDDLIVELGWRFWHFRRSLIPYQGNEAVEIRAHEVTELQLLNQELEKKNTLLERRGEELRAYAREVGALTVERELLDRKADVHNELGRLLAETRAHLRAEHVDEAALEGLWKRWRLSAALVLRGGAQEMRCEGPCLMEQLRQTARSVGVELTTEGDLPERGKPAELLLAVGSEALANLMRHADGNELRIRCRRLSGGWSCELTNNGKVPSGPIVEGGGLTSLRAKLEAAGGSMRVESWPVFKLMVLLPAE